ncbi:MAG: hypothetical protein FWH14_08220, partial [Oscillospiraceae bacterium]|nr:hypothetical protein [Oscillospiraceae bacterium]
ELEIIVRKPQFPSGEGCRRSGGVVCRGGNLPPVVITDCRVRTPVRTALCEYAVKRRKGEVGHIYIRF